MPLLPILGLQRRYSLPAVGAQWTPPSAQSANFREQLNKSSENPRRSPAWSLRFIVGQLGKRDNVATRRVELKYVRKLADRLAQAGLADGIPQLPRPCLLGRLALAVLHLLRLTFSASTHRPFTASFLSNDQEFSSGRLPAPGGSVSLDIPGQARLGAAKKARKESGT